MASSGRPSASRAEPCAARKHLPFLFFCPRTLRPTGTHAHHTSRKKDHEMPVHDSENDIRYDELADPIMPASAVPISPAAVARSLQKLQRVAEPPAHRGFVPADFQETILQWKRNPSLLLGLPIPRFTQLTSALGGIRHGELTVFTGPTGAGKTTFLSQITMDMALEHKSSILWGSFEIPANMMARKMLVQFAGQPVEEQPDAAIAANLRKLDRIQFMPMFGSTSIAQVIARIECYMELAPVDLVVLDNLQFFLSGQGDASGDKFFLQEAAVHAIRELATRRNTHIALVVHPRKPAASRFSRDAEELSLDSIGGSAKVTQEADNVLLLQRDPSRGLLRLDLAKNRFSGALAQIHLKYHPESMRYTEAPGNLGGTPQRREKARPWLPLQKNLEFEM
ncbi:P-loop containing nucleoside triphosphate hydrolase protein [Blastocladiella britannica]|nr:P-loop containing nucleoside triphosphate hydrolase protein [Blastocladiella britannica]